MNNDNSDFMGIKGLAEFLGLSVHGIYKMVREERIPGYKLDTTYRFSKSEIKKWLESQRIGPKVNEFIISEPNQIPDKYEEKRILIERFKEEVKSRIKGDVEFNQTSYEDFEIEFNKNIRDEGLKELKKDGIYIRKNKKGKFVLRKE